MENKIIGSLYIGKYSTLLVVLEKNENGYNLMYIKRIKNILNLNELLTNPNFTIVINEICGVLHQYSITDFFVTLGTDYYITTNIPRSFIDNKNDFLKLVDLSIKQHYPDKTIADFGIKSIPIHYENKIEFVCMINKDIIFATKNLIEMLGYTLTDVNPAHISIINSYMYNYIDSILERAVLIQLLDNVFEFTIIADNNLIGLEYCVIDRDVSSVLETKIEQIVNDYSIKVDSIYLYGDTLNKQTYIKCWETSMIFDINCKRLNALRLISSNLSKREKDHCMRMFHSYNYCIGAALPNHLGISVI